MFINARYKDRIRPFTGDYHFIYIVEDDDFTQDTEVEVIVPASVHAFIDVVIAVIDVYSGRGLPVAPNLVLAIQQENRLMGTPYSTCIRVIGEHPKSQRYQVDVEKLMLLV
jgi:hypothetical protein